ncbi:MAG: glycosyltransferase [Burkholderiales bacterium]|nr:glycosyltransferase [Burkholderiales bacterium]
MSADATTREAMAPIVPVALVMPLRNEAHAMEDFFLAYRRFTVLPREIMFVDTGSTDGTRDLVAAWCAANRGDGVNACLLDLPGGLPGAGRNHGVAMSTAPWIAFLDAGIRPESDWLQQLVACAEREGADAVLGACRFGSEHPVGLAVCALTNGAGRIRPVLPASLFARGVFDRAGGFAPGLRAGEDVLWLAGVRARCGAPAQCRAARVHYGRYPETLAAAFLKWMRYERSMVGTPVGRRKRAALFITVAFGLAGAAFSAAAVPALLAGYAVLRGGLDPIRRSRDVAWWRNRPSAVFLAPLVALALDTGSAVGTLAGWARRGR